MIEVLQSTITMSHTESESANEVETEPCSKRKKGVRRPQTYNVNRIKKARIEGGEYVNYKGKVVEARTTGLPCS